jgi:hypothetical protein
MIPAHLHQQQVGFRGTLDAAHQIHDDFSGDFSVDPSSPADGVKNALSRG